MSKFRELKVHRVNRELTDAVSVEFLIPKDLQEDFKFKSGQYLTFKKEVKGEEIRRSYSICAAPYENILRVGIKEVPKGLFSTYANRELSAGDILDTMIPMGNFTPEIKATNKKHYVLFASGSGITPIISIAKDILHNEPGSQVSLYYGNKNFDSILFREELEGLKNTYTHRFSMHHVLSRSFIGTDLNRGRLDAEKCEALSSTLLDIESADHFFICGPFDMIMGIKDWLASKNVEASKVHFELFGVPDKKTESKTKADTPKNGVKVEVLKDGDTMKFNLADPSKTILDAAHELGMDLPFACKGGVCCTCKAKVLEGKVEMLKNYAIEPDEVEKGYVLTCQSVATSEHVVISFDE